MCKAIYVPKERGRSGGDGETGRGGGGVEQGARGRKVVSRSAGRREGAARGPHCAAWPLP